MRQIIVGVLSFAVLISSMTIGVNAATETNVDESVIEALYEKTDNPNMWLEFINSQSEDSTGKWLPELIKKLTIGDTMSDKELVDVSYTTVTRGYDWGPAIDKVIIDFGQPLSGSQQYEDIFTVKSIRNFKDFSYATFSFADAATDHVVERNIVKAYVSNADGVATDNGNYIAFELEVGPALTEGSPFNYNGLSRYNEYVDTSYEISINPGGYVSSEEGTKLTMLPTGMDEKIGDVKFGSDRFVHNQPYSYNDIDLLYASFTPEKDTADAEVPLVIWLHGAGEGGKDTTIPILGNEAVNLVSDEYQAFFGDNGAYVLVPQNETIWMDVDGTKTYNTDVEGSNGVSYYTEALTALIKEFVNAHPDIDTDRIYIGGCSNGGYMTVNMIVNNPDYFAAAFPICVPYSAEWISEDRVNALLDIPIWFTHSLTDSVVPIAEGEGNMFNYQPTLDKDGKPVLLDNNTNALYSRLLEAGHKSVYYTLWDKVEDTSDKYFKEDGVTPYEYIGHWSWVYTLNNENVEVINGKEVTIFEWLGQQSK